MLFSVSKIQNQNATRPIKLSLNILFANEKSNNSEVVKIYIFLLVIFTWIVFIKQTNQKISVLFYKTKEKPRQKEQMRLKKTKVSYISL